MLLKKIVILIVLAIFYVGMVDTVVNDQKRRYLSDCHQQPTNPLNQTNQPDPEVEVLKRQL
ncbi:MAG: hypothetical protein AAF298_22410 [Cyanobacteria bacterium P01_A01_bin.40]